MLNIQKSTRNYDSSCLFLFMKDLAKSKEILKKFKEIPLKIKLCSWPNNELYSALRTIL
jgi:hypothetical protein